MGKDLEIFGPAEHTRGCYDQNDLNDKRCDGRGPDRTFGRLYRFCRTLHQLEHQRPDYIGTATWRQAIQDGRRFVSQWGEQADALGWTDADLFRLHEAPEKPAKSHPRLSQLDTTSLIWLPRGRPVVDLAATETVFRVASGAILTCPSSQLAQVAQRAA